MSIEIRDIHKSFGENEVLKGISLSLAPGEVVSLVGENGAGKSTLTSIISGAHKQDSGQLFIDGTEHRFATPQQAMAQGIQVIYQEIKQNLFPHLDVASNLFARDHESQFGTFFVRKKLMHERASRVLESVGLKLDTRALVSSLSVGEQQMVQIAKSIHHKVRLLILDEPTAALDQSESEQLFEQINKLREQGVAIIYISHRLPEVFALSDHIVVLRDGQISLRGTPEELTETQVVSAMVGEQVEDFYPKEQHATDRQRLVVSNFSSPGSFENINFEVHAGEVLGMGGVMGSGKSEILRCLFGLQKYTGEILIDQKPVRPRTTRQAIDNSIAYLTPDRQAEGLVLAQSIAHNQSLATLAEITAAGLVNRQQEQQRSEAMRTKLNIKSTSIHAPVSSLSGGNQQKVLLARWLLCNPKVLLLDEPTRGVDVGAKAEIYRIIQQAAAEGMAVVMVSSDLPELVEMSDRVIVLRAGAQVAHLAGSDLTQQSVLEHALESVQS